MNEPFVLTQEMLLKEAIRRKASGDVGINISDPET